MTNKQKVGSEQVSGPAALRERIARHLATDGTVSNFEAVCDRIERRRGAPQIECPDCDGLGFMPLSTQDLKAFSRRIAEKQEAGANWETIDRERRRLNRESMCPKCRGTCYVRNTGQGDELPPDTMFTTIACPDCRGRMKTKQGGTLRGASCGEKFPPTDASAEHGDACPKCLGDAYIVKHVARPKTKSGEIYKYAEEYEEFPMRLGQKAAASPENPAAVVAEIEQEDPVLAAATMALLGPTGDEWALHQWGRRFALWPLTDAGRQLIAEHPTDGLELDAYQRSLRAAQEARLSEVQAERGNPRRRALLGLADSQARQLEQRVERAIRKAEAA
jgi:hypothetical protein